MAVLVVNCKSEDVLIKREGTYPPDNIFSIISLLEKRFCYLKAKTSEVNPVSMT